MQSRTSWDGVVEIHTEREALKLVGWLPIEILAPYYSTCCDEYDDATSVLPLGDGKPNQIDAIALVGVIWRYTPGNNNVIT